MVIDYRRIYPLHFGIPRRSCCSNTSFCVRHVQKGEDKRLSSFTRSRIVYKVLHFSSISMIVVVENVVLFNVPRHSNRRITISKKRLQASIFFLVAVSYSRWVRILTNLLTVYSFYLGDNNRLTGTREDIEKTL